MEKEDLVQDTLLNIFEDDKWTTKTKDYNDAQLYAAIKAKVLKTFDRALTVEVNKHDLNETLKEAERLLKDNNSYLSSLLEPLDENLKNFLREYFKGNRTKKRKELFKEYNLTVKETNYICAKIAKHARLSLSHIEVFEASYYKELLK